MAANPGAGARPVVDPALAVASRALAVGDPLEALKRVALRDDPPALALHGAAMAQLGELGRAAELLRARGGGRHVARGAPPGAPIRAAVIGTRSARSPGSDARGGVGGAA